MEPIIQEWHPRHHCILFNLSMEITHCGETKAIHSIFHNFTKAFEVALWEDSMVSRGIICLGTYMSSKEATKWEKLFVFNLYLSSYFMHFLPSIHFISIIAKECVFFVIRFRRLLEILPKKFSYELLLVSLIGVFIAPISTQLPNENSSQLPNKCTFCYCL